MFPKIIYPMEPQSSEVVPTDANYLHSVKWDGVRQLVFVSQEGVRIQNRQTHDRTSTYPELHQLKQISNGKEMVFDGEVISLKDGKPNFSKVMKRDFVRSEAVAKKLNKTYPITYMIFDLLYIDGKNLMQRTLGERLELLQQVIQEQNENIQIVSHINNGEALYQTTQSIGLEGIVSKHKESFYHQGEKRKDWLKIKHIKDINVVIGGYTVKNELLNSLAVGVYHQVEGINHRKFIYIGNVSTGLNMQEIRLLNQELKKVHVLTSPFVNYKKDKLNQYWVEPMFTLKVNYLEFTDEGRLRHPTIQGFLTIPAQDCIL
ncbi:hypothetical protein BHU72_03215 [Desulfuribacillus stibiiarsenatis]|uniref:DNA ligase (ATP) n=1 Tax=Desulfuribacillus stibiiarsenatis TaxID=1390249 RepID=A0A1E5L717_9FIRM|nr:non-homologous end-joining DNA ligase [Desulfuribacillus stibiiarsenatis]OEH85804.1 hypothetical protein BHU72_03215 [Desulfuribacillus stibiiarsenatis]